MKKCLKCNKKFEGIKSKLYCSDKCLRDMKHLKENIKKGQFILREDVKIEDYLIENYKEPLSKNTGHFGYYGAITKEKQTGMLQCNYCGNFYKSLGIHLSVHREELEKHRKSKNDSQASIYKRIFGLMQKTALCTQEIRNKMIETQLKMPWERIKYRKTVLKNVWKVKKQNNNRKQTAEKENIKGICPLQTLNKIYKKAIEIGRTPKTSDFYPAFNKLAVKHFGSWNDAIKILRLEPNTKNGSDSNLRLKKLTPEFLIDCMKNLTKEKKRRPVVSDCYNKELPAFELYIKEFGSWKKAKERAFNKTTK